MAKKMNDDPRCGNCALFVLAQRSYCGCRWEPGAEKLSRAFAAGGPGHAMWVTDGQGCETWEPIEEKPGRARR